MRHNIYRDNNTPTTQNLEENVLNTHNISANTTIKQAQYFSVIEWEDK